MVHSILIPSRFLLTLGHFIATIVIFDVKAELVMASLPATSGSTNVAMLVDYTKTNEYHALMRNATLAMVFFALDFIGLLGGFTMFFPKVNALQCMCHFVGGCLVANMLQHHWHVAMLEFVLVCCHGPAIVAEMMAFWHILYGKATQY